MADTDTQPTKKRTGGVPTSLGGAISAQAAIANDENKFASDMDSKLNDISKAEASSLDDFHKQISALKSNAPKIPELKPFQPPPQQNPAQSFGSFAGILATLASFETKTPLTTSLSAMAAGMKAVREGNQQAYDQAFKEWQINTDYAFKVAGMENERYMQSIDLAKTDYQTAMSNLQAQATMMQDHAALFTLRSQGIQGLGDLIAKREQLGIEAMKARNVLMRQGQAQQKKMQEASQYDSALAQIDKAEKELQSSGNEPVTGAGGFVMRHLEGIGGQLSEIGTGKSIAQPARNFDTQMEAVKTQVRNLISKSHYMSAGAVQALDDLMKGEGVFDTKADALKSLATAKEIIAQQRAGLSQTPVDAFSDSDSTYVPGEIITGSDGKKYRVTGGDPSDPDIEPVK